MPCGSGCIKVVTLDRLTAACVHTAATISVHDAHTIPPDVSVEPAMPQHLLPYTHLIPASRSCCTHPHQELARLAADNSLPPVTGGRARRKPDIFRYTEEDHAVRRKPKLSAAELQRQQRREAAEEKRRQEAAERRYTERQLILLMQQGKMPAGVGSGSLNGAVRGERRSGRGRGSRSDGEEDEEDSEEGTEGSDDVRTGATGQGEGSTDEEEEEEEEGDSDDPRRALLTEDEGAGCRYPLRNKQAGQPSGQDKQQQKGQLRSRLRSRWGQRCWLACCWSAL
jgi:hypothetical protein